MKNFLSPHVIAWSLYKLSISTNRIYWQINSSECVCNSFRESEERFAWTPNMSMQTFWPFCKRCVCRISSNILFAYDCAGSGAGLLLCLVHARMCIRKYACPRTRNKEKEWKKKEERRETHVGSCSRPLRRVNHKFETPEISRLLYDRVVKASTRILRR